MAERFKSEKDVCTKESVYRESFDGLTEGDFIGAMKIANDAALSHSGYQHYMSLPNLKKMIEGRSMWLSRLDNDDLNDWNEFGKYGAPYGWRHTYIGCFSYGRSESAAMWKMYCRPNRNAVRILISPKGMRAWNDQLHRADSVVAHPIFSEGVNVRRGVRRVRVKCAGLSDVLYVSMKGNDEGGNGSGVVRWNGIGVPIEDLQEFVRCKGVEGFVKDLAWQYEQETRLFVILKNEQGHAKRLSLHVPDKVFESMSIILSPWLPPEDVDATIDRVSSWFDCQGLAIPKVIRQSSLSGALWSWQKS